MTIPESSDGIRVPIVYVGLEDVVVAHANHFALQLDQGDFVLTIGQVVSPLTLGDEEDQREQLQRVGYVPAKPLTRVVLTRQRAHELRELLDRQIALYDKTQGGAQ